MYCGTTITLCTILHNKYITYLIWISSKVTHDDAFFDCQCGHLLCVGPIYKELIPKKKKNTKIKRLYFAYKYVCR